MALSFTSLQDELLVFHMHATIDCCAGGGLYCSFPSERSVVRGCKFIKNKAAQYGGAIYEQNVADGAVQASKSHHVPPLFKGSHSM